MSIKGFRLLWIQIKIPSKKFPSISFPISIYICQELLDCLLDLLTVTCFTVPILSKPNATSRVNIYSIKELVTLVMKLLDSLTDGESYDLVDVTTDKVKVLIKIM